MIGVGRTRAGGSGRTEAQFDILVADGFVLTELAAVVDVLRIANRVCPCPPFGWTFRSAGGGRIESSSGAGVDTLAHASHPDADYAFVLGNSDPENPALSLGRAITTYTFRNAQVFLLAEAASRYIRDRGVREGSHTTHWENLVLLRERSDRLDANHAIATEHGAVVTCAGMGATVDVALAVIGRHVSSAVQMTVADILLHERIRDFASLQPFGGLKPSATGDDKLDQCIRIMQANVEDPLPIHELVAVLGLSSRSLERRFRTLLNTTPNGFYREIRLGRANNLLLNTSLSIREIGLACGFASGFSAVYKAVFGVTPAALRQRRRMAAQ